MIFKCEKASACTCDTLGRRWDVLQMGNSFRRRSKAKRKKENKEVKMQRGKEEEQQAVPK